MLGSADSMSKINDTLDKINSLEVDAHPALHDSDLGESEDEIVARGLDWREQLSVKSVLIGTFTGILIIFISLNISLSGAGISPGYSVVSALIGYSVMKPLTMFAQKFWNKTIPFTPQENCIMQAIATSIQSLVHSLGVSAWFWALNENSAAQLDLGISTYAEFMVYKATHPLPLPNTVPANFGNMCGMAFLTAFTGVLIVALFRRLYIIDLDLPFPSPTATAVMIQQFFTTEGRELADRQLKWFTNISIGTFSWAGFNWLTSAEGCASYGRIPIFGLAAVGKSWYLNWNDYLNFLGIGLIMTENVTFSIFVGSVLTYGIVYPILWDTGLPQQPADVSQAEIDQMVEDGGYWFYQGAGSSMDGFYGYKVMWGMIILLADGLFAICVMLNIFFQQWRKKKNSNKIELQKSSGDSDKELSADEVRAKRDRRINERIFLEDGFNNKILVLLFVLMTALGCIGIPLIYDVEWYMILVAFILTPIFSMIGNYVAGLTDWNLTSNFAKITVILFGSWAGKADPDNAIMVALITCGIVYCAASNSTDIIGDLKTGFLLRTSPKALIISQLWGFAIGCLATPLIFLSFISTQPDTGFRDAKYPNSYGVIYRAMAFLGTSGGFEALPKHCMTITWALFAYGFFSPFLKMMTLSKLKSSNKMRAHFWVEFLWPTPSALGIPFIAGIAWAIPACLGLLIKLIWQNVNRKHYENFYQVVAAAVLVGIGCWSIPNIILDLIGVEAPASLCLKFYNYEENPFAPY
jgi:OPT family oligopeptide transporter